MDASVCASVDTGVAAVGSAWKRRGCLPPACAGDEAEDEAVNGAEAFGGCVCGYD